MGFMKCYGHIFNHARPQKFGLDRTNWWKYGVFFDMCDSIGKALVWEKIHDDVGGTVMARQG